MRVLFIVPSYEPAWAFGGTVTATVQLCKALVRRGLDVTVYTTDANGSGSRLEVPIDEEVRLEGVKIRYYRCNFGISKGFYSKGLRLQLDSAIHQVDLVHCSAIWQWILIDVSKACRKAGIPFIVSPHGSFNPWPWNHKKCRKRLFWHLVGRKAIRDAKALHFTSEDERVNAMHAIPMFERVPGFVIPNGVMIKKGYNIRNKQNTSPSKFVLLFVGRIHRIKGIHLVFEALAKLRDPRITFYVVGHREDVAYASMLEDWAKDLPNEVLFIGDVHPDETWDYYASADLLALPSYNENFSMVAVEAMASGLPVLISKNVGIWKDVQADKAGYIVDNDVDSIAQAIKTCLEEPESLRSLSENCIDSARKRYDIDHVAVLMMDAYKEVIGSRCLNGSALH